MSENRANKGFTLIEILIVIFIIGLLASVVLVGLGSFRQRGRDTRRVADLRSVQNGLELYYSKNGSYPQINNWAGLQSELVNSGIGIENIPNDPDKRAVYEYAGDGQSYVLKAVLEDKNNSVLREDIDSLQFGSVDCGPASEDDRYYCVKF